MTPGKLSSNKLILGIITLAVLALPVYYWGDLLSWNFSSLDAIAIFPLLGLLAYSVIWLQMLVTAALPLEESFKEMFFLATGAIFLLLIIAHPLLLSISQYQSNLTVTDYVGSSRTIFVTLALIAWIIFIFYELFSRLRSWRHFNKSMTIFRYLNYVAFYLIFFHSVNLGTHLQGGGLKYIWYFYAISGAVFIVNDIRRNIKLT